MHIVGQEVLIEMHMKEKECIDRDRAREVKGHIGESDIGPDEHI